MGQEPDGAGLFAQGLDAERQRVVALCAHLTGRVDVAEDLAQETLVEAWRHVGALRDTGGRAPWLTAIARHVCLRWARAHAREVRHRPAFGGADLASAVALLGAHADDIDVEVAVERAEVAALLHRALALLPPHTRTALIARYVEQSPIADIAARLESNEGTITKRIARGTLTLRRLLTTDLRADADACGLPVATTPAWRETRLWCPHCGARRLVGRFVVHAGTAEFALRCPACFAASGRPTTDARGPRVAQLVRGVKGYKPALTRLSLWAHDYYQHGLTHGTVRCTQCGRPHALLRGLPNDVPPLLRGMPGVYVRCPVCRKAWWTTLSGLALWLPAGQRFWRRHPRLRTLPTREVEAEGSRALVTSFESVSDAARLDIIYAHDTYALMGIHGAPAE